MIRIFVSERASADTDRLESWLLEHGASYATDLGNQLEAAIGGLMQYPERAPKSRDGRYRELYVAFHSNQYVVQYQVRRDRGHPAHLPRLRRSLNRPDSPISPP